MDLFKLWGDTVNTPTGDITGAQHNLWGLFKQSIYPSPLIKYPQLTHIVLLWYKPGRVCN